MTTDTGMETVTELGQFQLPWNKQMKVQGVTFDSGVKLLRIRVREGKRFTIFDIDPDNAADLAALLGDWSRG